jgi:MFS family permease
LKGRQSLGPSDSLQYDVFLYSRGFYQSVYCIGITLGPVIMGFLADHTSARLSFIVMASIALGGAVAILPIYK